MAPSTATLKTRHGSIRGSRRELSMKETEEVTLITHVNTKVEVGRMTGQRVLIIMQGGNICPDERYKL